MSASWGWRLPSVPAAFDLVQCLAGPPEAGPALSSLPTDGESPTSAVAALADSIAASHAAALAPAVNTATDVTAAGDKPLTGGILPDPDTAPQPAAESNEELDDDWGIGDEDADAEGLEEFDDDEEIDDVA